jgi:hypothetical protein
MTTTSTTQRGFTREQMQELLALINDSDTVFAGGLDEGVA